MPQSKVRVVGSGFTTFNYAGQPIAWLESVVDTGQPPLSPPEPIQPLGWLHPREIVTGRALGNGSLTLTIRELWNEPVWYQLAGLGGTPDIAQVWNRLAEQASFVTCQMIISPPGASVVRGKVFHNCVVTAIDDGDSLTIGALSIAKSITVHYTHTTVLSGSA